MRERAIQRLRARARTCALVRGRAFASVFVCMYACVCARSPLVALCLFAAFLSFDDVGALGSPRASQRSPICADCRSIILFVD
eukprot:15466347-Alexandrium_andersonii.AAC.1